MALLFYLIRCLLQLLLGWVMDFQPQQLTREREGKHSQPHTHSLSLMTLCHSVFIEPWIKCFKRKISKHSPGPKPPLQSIRDTLAIFERTKLLCLAANPHSSTQLSLGTGFMLKLVELCCPNPEVDPALRSR